MTNTIQYYEKHAKEYTEKTINTNMTKTYNMFEKYLKPNDHILDLGCGSGRDTKHFITNYHVTALDPVKAFLNNVPENINKLNLNATDIIKHEELYNSFDAIFACASLLHIPQEDLKEVFLGCYKILKDEGIMYVSFKYGDYVGIRDGRYYIDLTKETIKDYIGHFHIVETSITGDNLQRDNRWLNCILRK
ncbi:class I SAM-dependent methyltransferase [Sharpea azabuensis]|uniref:class I SAM-dependent methyltransferase n=1 Tax=Sharpea azabuensis TaxID=322505 RepID=UPI0013D8F26B|nr:class I SAM-dependent methyltransferase [Sharpea azabuensis]MDD6512684.1 class I SAM-dependent methyltransferase [Sharpea azabuensis]